jgi:hypothetical protein
MRILAIANLICMILFAQPRPAWLQENFENGDFSRGRPGEFPVGWHLGPLGTQDFAAEIVAGQACNSGKQCATVRPLGVNAAKRCFLHQIYEAGRFAGQRVKFRAAVRVTGNGYARLLLRIHRLNGSTSFRDDMGDHPIRSSEWAFYELEAPLPPDVGDIELGIQDFEQGIATIDQISVTYGK